MRRAESLPEGEIVVRSTHLGPNAIGPLCPTLLALLIRRMHTRFIIHAPSLGLPSAVRGRASGGCCVVVASKWKRQEGLGSGRKVFSRAFKQLFLYKLPLLSISVVQSFFLHSGCVQVKKGFSFSSVFVLRE